MLRQTRRAVVGGNERERTRSGWACFQALGDVFQRFMLSGISFLIFIIFILIFFVQFFLILVFVFFCLFAPDFSFLIFQIFPA